MQSQVRPRPPAPGKPVVLQLRVGLNGDSVRGFRCPIAVRIEIPLGESHPGDGTRSTEVPPVDVVNAIMRHFNRPGERLIQVRRNIEISFLVINCWVTFL